jgi:hypothetical protein
MKLSLFLAPLAAIAGALLFAQGCPAPVLQASAPLCTGGSYAHCICQNSSQGTHRCQPDGRSFDDCLCDSTNAIVDDAGFQQYDAGDPPDVAPATLAINDACAGKLAAIVGAQGGVDLFGAAYAGGGKWTVTDSRNGALRGVPRGGLIIDPSNVSAVVAVWESLGNQYVWTKFQANQTSLLSPAQVGPAPPLGPAGVQGRPGFIDLGYKSAELVALTTDSHFAHGTYTPSLGFSFAGTIDAGAVALAGAPAIVNTPTGLAMAYSDSSKNLFFQQKLNGLWANPEALQLATAYDSSPPELISFADGSLLLVYREAGSSKLSWMKRTGTTWSGKQYIDPLDIAADTPTTALMADGRVMLAWKGDDNGVHYSIYDNTSDGGTQWSEQATIASGESVQLSPFLVNGKCAGTLSAAWAETDGFVKLAFFGTDGTWSEPFVLPGLTGMTYVAVAEIP